MGPTWVLSAPDGPHIGPINLAIREGTWTAVPPMAGWNYRSHTPLPAKIQFSWATETFFHFLGH